MGFFLIEKMGDPSDSLARPDLWELPPGSKRW